MNIFEKSFFYSEEPITFSFLLVFVLPLAIVFLFVEMFIDSFRDS